jgi:hypothetical protein
MHAENNVSYTEMGRSGFRNVVYFTLSFTTLILMQCPLAGDSASSTVANLLGVDVKLSRSTGVCIASKQFKIISGSLIYGRPRKTRLGVYRQRPSNYHVYRTLGGTYV